MKFTALLIVVAVCAALLPSDVEAVKATPDLRALVRRAPLEVAKRHVVKRDDDDSDSSDSDSSDSDSSEELDDFFASDEVAKLLAEYGITMEDLDNEIESDDDIDPEDRVLVKALAIMVLASLEDDSSEESSSEEDK